MTQQQIVEILKNHSNPWGYQLCGEDSFEEVAEEVMGLFKPVCDACGYWLDKDGKCLRPECMNY